MRLWENGSGTDRRVDPAKSSDPSLQREREMCARERTTKKKDGLVIHPCECACAECPKPITKPKGGETGGRWENQSLGGMGCAEEGKDPATRGTAPRLCRRAAPPPRLGSVSSPSSSMTILFFLPPSLSLALSRLPTPQATSVEARSRCAHGTGNPPAV